VTEDPYIDAATGVLRNKLGVSDSGELAEVEGQLSILRDADLADDPEPGSFDSDHLQRIHRRLFGDVYAWAGEVRTCDISRTTRFAHAEFIEDGARRIFGELAAENWLRGLPRDDFLGLPPRCSDLS
jgi:cell filamentation protein